MNPWRALVVVLAALAIAACGSARPILYSDKTLTEGKPYEYRVPVVGCSAPIVAVNGRRWEPDKPWILPLPKGWHVTAEGGESHHTWYLDLTVRVDGNQLVVSLPDGNVVNRYHTTDKQLSACV